MRHLFENILPNPAAKCQKSCQNVENMMGLRIEPRLDCNVPFDIDLLIKDVHVWFAKIYVYSDKE